MASKGKGIKRRENILSALNCQKVHVNDLWSLWYCIGITAFSVYLISVSIQRFAMYIVYPWPFDSQPYFELNAYVGFVGAAIVLMPFFIVSALICVGNLANDGYHLGSQTDSQLLNFDSKHALGFIRTIWLHCGPTASLLHMLSAFCLLIPKVLMQAQLVVHGFVTKDAVWHTDLDFLFAYKERMLALTDITARNVSNSRNSAGSDTKNVNLPQELHQLDESAMFPFISPEFLNYALALMVYSIRYPVVFWTTNKTLSCLFSFQLMQNGIQSLLSFAGFSLLYKLQSFECENILPSSENCLLSPLFSALLYIIYNVTVIGSGSLVYIYIYQKYKVYMSNERRKQRIVWKSDNILWSYLSHCAALILLILLAVLSGPIIYDYMVVYRNSLDSVILACVISTLMHLFCWIVLWLFLTLTNNWKFHYDYMETQQLLHNLEKLSAANGSADQSLIVINDGLSYVINDPAQKSTIANIVERSNCNDTQVPSADDEEEIYWLKPKTLERKETSDNDQPSWFGRRRSSHSQNKHKVMFDNSALNGNSSKYRSSSKSPKINKFKKQSIKFEDLTDSDDDGDYATLRDLPLVQEENEDEAIDVSNDYYKKKAAAFDEIENEDSLLSEIDKASMTRAGSVQSNQGNYFHKEKGSIGNGISLPTPLSGSSSPSPPGKYSETSSGIHSSSSISENPSRRSSSVDEMQVIGLNNKQHGNWRSMSLQRTNYPSNYFASRHQKYDNYIPHENSSYSDQENAPPIHKPNQSLHVNFVEELTLSNPQPLQNPVSYNRSLNNSRSEQKKPHHRNLHYGSSNDFTSKSSRPHRDLSKHSLTNVAESANNLNYC